MLSWFCLAIGLHCMPNGGGPSATHQGPAYSTRSYVTASFSELSTGHERRVLWPTNDGAFGRVEWGQLRNGFEATAVELGYVRRLRLLPGVIDLLMELAVAGLHVAPPDKATGATEILAMSSSVGVETRAGPLVIGLAVRSRHGLTEALRGELPALRITVRTSEG